MKKHLLYLGKFERNVCYKLKGILQGQIKAVFFYGLWKLKVCSSANLGAFE